MVNNLNSFGSEKEIIQRLINTTDSEIGRLVYELYRLTNEEIAIVRKACLNLSMLFYTTFANPTRF